MSYGYARYDGNSYSIWSKIKKWQAELDAIKHGSAASHFSPEEIREIITNVREASARLGEQASPDRLSLIREVTKKLEELTQTVLAKSSWDKRFGTTQDDSNAR